MLRRYLLLALVATSILAAGCGRTSRRFCCPTAAPVVANANPCCP